ncbi:MAG: helix-turn-helix domain-containing protein [Pseudomonadota bacterium]|nr:helix-turn-helix domain-containing protein [Pseudomonadota bacterium]
MNKLITPDNLSELLQVPKSWIYENAKSGKIPSIRLGKYVRFDLDAVQKVLNQQTQGSLKIEAIEYRRKSKP